MQESRFFFIAGAVSGFLSVAFGAFGAHGLKTRVSQEMLAVFETGVKYQMYHALALLAAAWAITQFPPNLVKLSGWFFIFGSVIFSGSLYALVFSGVKSWGAVTPVGGLLLLSGWLTLIFAGLQK